MPLETEQAVEWALTQTYKNLADEDYPVTKDTPDQLVGAVREYFNANSIEYSTFSYDDLVSFL